MDKYQALDRFWKSFDVPAYDSRTVPEDAQMPYITYEANTNAWGQEVASTSSIWYYSSSWEGISKKAEEISRALGLGGRICPYSGGAMWIKRGEPFAQRLADENDMVRRVIINVSIEFISED